MNVLILSSLEKLNLNEYTKKLIIDIFKTKRHLKLSAIEVKELMKFIANKDNKRTKEKIIRLFSGVINDFYQKTIIEKKDK